MIARDRVTGLTLIAHVLVSDTRQTDLDSPAGRRLEMHARHQHGRQRPVAPSCFRRLESRNGQRIIGHGGDTIYFHSDLHLLLA